MAFPHNELRALINTATAESVAVHITDLEEVGPGPGRSPRCNRALSIWLYDEKAKENIGDVRMFWADDWPDFSVIFTDDERVKTLVLRAIPNMRLRSQH